VTSKTPEYESSIPGVAAPIGMYSHMSYLMKPDMVVLVAGQVGIEADGALAGTELAEQLSCALRNVERALMHVGMDLRNVLKFTTYLTDSADIDRFYAARERLFAELYPTGSYPPNTLLVVSRLVRPELRVEVEAIAGSGAVDRATP